MDEPEGVEWLTVQQVAARFQVHEETVRRWIRDGELPVLDLGGKRGEYRVKLEDLAAFIDRRYGTMGKLAA